MVDLKKAAAAAKQSNSNLVRNAEVNNIICHQISSVIVLGRRVQDTNAEGLLLFM